MLSNQRLLDLISKYSAAPGDARLELRFKNLSREMFTDVYGVFAQAAASITYDVVVVSEDVYEVGRANCDDICYSRRLTFNGQAVASDRYVHTVRLEKPVNVGGYIRCEAVIVQDRQSDKFASASSAQVNFNITTTVSAGAWNVDLICTRRGVLSELSTELKNLRKSLFIEGLKPTEFVDRVSFEDINTYSVILRTDNHQPNMTEAAELLQKIFSAANPVHAQDAVYQTEIYDIAKYLYTGEALNQFKHPENRLKKLSTQVVALSKITYYNDVYPPTGLLATDKADGQRAIISINGNRVRIVKSDSIEERLVGDHVPGPITIVDAEIAPDGTGALIPYLFDVIAIGGTSVADVGLEERIKHAQAAVDALSALGVRAAAKKYYEIEATPERQFRSIWESKYPYELDGIIISRPGQPYVRTQHYKWKPYSHNTIDFLAVRAPSTMLGIKPYEKREGFDLYLLFVGVLHRLRERLGIGLIPEYNKLFDTRGAYYPVQFSPSMNPLAYIYYHPAGENLDRKIVELSRSEDNSQWVFHRVRNDRLMERNYYGNDFRTAEATYTNYVDVFAFEDLWKAPTSYFVKNAGTIYDAPNKYKRFVISSVLKVNLAGAAHVIDEAAGRGADLHRYEAIGVQSALFMDIDATAIAELIRRKLGAIMAPRGQKRGGAEARRAIPYDQLIVKDVRGMTVHTLVVNLKDPAADLEASVYQYGMIPGGVDGIVCNFAFHYMCDTVEHIRNLLRFNATMLKVGGVFMFTVMDGARVFELLKTYKTGEQWESREGQALKYAIRKKYSADKLTPAGQMISVLLPFSDEMYDEPLCNVDYVVKEASKLGLAVELNQPMDDMIDKFAAANRLLHEALTPEDRAYIALHRYITLRRVR